MKKPPLIVHAIHHFIMGGLENGLVNLINTMPIHRYRHAIVCLDRYSSFRERLKRDDVDVYAMHCKPGRDPAVAWRLWQLFRRLRPDIVHSRNLSGLDALLPATLAGVRCRIHSEHGWHDGDPEGSNRKYRLIRRIHRPLVNRYVALSGDLQEYLCKHVGVAESSITKIHNGVDTKRFCSTAQTGARPHCRLDFAGPRHVIIGSVGRFQGIKDQLNLARAFVHLIKMTPALKDIVRLAIVGDGDEHLTVKNFLQESGVASLCWLPGAREEVPDILRSFDLFVLPSKGEGISNTVLEAMATGLPVVATRVGGNAELIVERQTGALVPASDAVALAAAIEPYVTSSALRSEHGAAARQRAEKHFSLEAMTVNYINLYDEMLRPR